MGRVGDGRRCAMPVLQVNLIRAAVGTVVLATAVFISNFASAATIVPTNQQRSVSAFVIVPLCPPGTMSDDELAVGFQPFNGMAQAERTCDLAHGAAMADQQSFINPATLEASGSTDCDVSATDSTIIHAIPGSLFDVTFTLASPVRYSIQGTLTASGALPVVASHSRVRLTTAAFQLIVEQIVTPNRDGSTNTQPVQIDGTLVPGAYRLIVECTSAVDSTVPPSGTGHSAYDVIAKLQRPGDANLDGSVNTGDILAVINSWGMCPQPCPPSCDADMSPTGSATGDCVVNVGDLLLVINNWGT